MESDRFDAFASRLAASMSRRRGLGLLGLLGLGVVATGDDVAARKKKKKKKNKHKNQPTCQPSCDGKTCGDNGCGGTCGACGPCQTCQSGVCTAKADGLTCGNECRVCQGGQCVARAEGAACGADSCTACRSGQCVAQADDSACAEQSHGLCRAGLCRGFPTCLEFGNHSPCSASNGVSVNCCYLNPGENCPPVIAGQQTCPERGIAGRRCRFDNDCLSLSCVGYQCT